MSGAVATRGARRETEEARLLADLVAIPSVSGEEDELAAFIETLVRRWGLDVDRDETGVRVEVPAARPGPTLALASHLDVVPPGDGWSRDPWSPAVEGNALHGRGAVDAKASVAAMLLAARDVARGGGPPAGRILVLLGLGEETRDTTMAALAETSGPIDAAVVGEPTGLDVAVAQRGLLRLDLVARGHQRHPGRRDEGEPWTNAIEVLARDLVALEGIGADRTHPLLGRVHVTPTSVAAGVSANVTPALARATLDVRTTPAWSHAELIGAVREAVRSDVEVVSERLVPCETPRPSRLLPAVLRVAPGAATFGSPTCSDWVFLRHLDVVKWGPGDSRRSHAPDEAVDLAEVAEARRLYALLGRTYGASAESEGA